LKALGRFNRQRRFVMVMVVVMDSVVSSSCSNRVVGQAMGEVAIPQQQTMAVVYVVMGSTSNGRIMTTAAAAGLYPYNYFFCDYFVYL
jgi:hypothetical protein